MEWETSNLENLFNIRIHTKRNMFLHILSFRFYVNRYCRVERTDEPFKRFSDINK